MAPSCKKNTYNSERHYTNIAYLGQAIAIVALNHEEDDQGCETARERNLHRETILELKKLVANIEFYHWQIEMGRFPR